MVQYVAIRVFQVQRHGGVQDMFWREGAPWWVRRGGKLDLGRSGQKGGVEDIANLQLVHLSSSGLWPWQGILEDPVLPQMHISKWGTLSWVEDTLEEWQLDLYDWQIWKKKQSNAVIPLHSACPGCLALEGIHYLLLQLECFRQAMRMIMPALSRSRCVHRDLTVALLLTLSSKPALLTNKSGICHSIFVIQVSINWLRPQDALRTYWKGSIFTWIMKQEIHLGRRPEKQICGYFKTSHED